MRFGKTQVQGSVQGDCWQKIYDYTVGETERVEEIKAQKVALRAELANL